MIISLASQNDIEAHYMPFSGLKEKSCVSLASTKVFCVINTELLIPSLFQYKLKSGVYVAVSLTHDKKMKKRSGPALKFRHTKIQSKNQLK